MTLHEYLYLGETLTKEHPTLASELLRNYLVRSEAKVLSESEVREFIKQVEQVFELPEGILTKKTESGRVGTGKANGYSLSEIRRAALFHLSLQTTMKPTYMSNMFSVTHEAVRMAIATAREYMNSRDMIFLSYYDKIKSINI